MNPKLRKTENLHILLWLLKDFCWISNYKILGLTMIIPTITVAILITWRTREISSELWHNLAIVCWISANSIWMIGEFYFNDSTRPYAIMFFVSGFLFVGYYYLIVEPFWKKKIKD